MGYPAQASGVEESTDLIELHGTADQISIDNSETPRENVRAYITRED
ncbi:hypothetical protein [Paenibacillus solani]|nr:hypothetical protein [Paenibacillus solani]